MSKEMSIYRFLIGDIDPRNHGGKWYKRISSDEFSYYVIESINMYSATGDISQGKYLFTVQDIHIDYIKPGELESALSFVGLDQEDHITELMKVEAISASGYCDTIHHEFTDSWDRTLRKLKQMF